jgi:hypothetical protein
MSFGLVEAITLLLGLSNFSLQPNPKPPTAETSLQYAMTDADFVVQLDAASIIPGNYKALTQLAEQPQIKASPELAKAVRSMVAEVEGLRGLARTTTGIDLATDISDATLCVQVVPKANPNLVAAVRGKFTTAMIDKIAKVTGKQTTRIGGGAMIEMGGNDPAVAVTKDGVLLAGTPKLIRDRLADSWKAPARAPNTLLAYAAEAIDAKPVFALVMVMTPTARKEALAGLGPKKNFASDVLQRHKLMAFSVFRDGIGWSWIDSSKPGLDAMAQISEGTIDLLRAAQLAPRAVAKIILGAIESYKGTDKQVDELIKRKADVMRIVESYTGDGQFKVKLDKNPATLRLDVRATGKTVSEVVPAGFFVPVGAFALLMLRSAPPKVEIAAPPPMTAPPARPVPVPPAPPKKAPAPAPPAQRP